MTDIPPPHREVGDSLPPIRHGITWPMVAYAFVREIPYTVMVIAGGVVAVVFVFRSPNSSFEPLAAVIGPAIVSALGRSRPPDDTIRLGGIASLVAMFWGGQHG
jgi:hypothetical protein